MTISHRMTGTVCRCSAAGLLAAASGAAWGQPADLDQRTGGLLVADQTLEAIYLTRDLDGDGAADSPGEATVWLDGSNASGLGLVTGNVFSVFQSASGVVYFADGDTDSVYRAADLDDDGNANGPGEVGVWFSPANAGGFTLPSPNGLWEPTPGVVFVLNAGTSSEPLDAIYRTEDLNGDGDADDAGEATLWMDISALFDPSTPFELTFIGEAAYFADLRGGDVDAIIRAEDADGSGSVDADEWGVFIDADNPWGVPIGFVAETDGTSLYVVDNLSSREQTVYRLTDLNGSGDIDDASEVELLWTESLLPSGAELGSVFTLAIGPGGSVAIGSSGSDAQDAVYLLTDLDGDGVFLSDGETSVWRGAGGGSDDLASRVRAVEFALGDPCIADFNGDGEVDTRDVLAFLNAWADGDSRADVNGDGVVDTRDVLEFLNLWNAGC